MMQGSVMATPFGTLPDGSRAMSYNLSLGNGVTAMLTDFGASLIGWRVPDRHGRLNDVVLGCDDVSELAQQTAYLGAAVGRVAGRVNEARFQLDGQEYRVATNSAPHHLHGGVRGFSYRLWSVEALDEELPAVRFTITSEDGDEGYPGEVQASLTYRLDPPARLVLTFEAVTNRPTPFSPTCHAYFNLDGHGAGSLASHTLHLLASRYTPVDDALIPTGEIAPVGDTPMDFSEPKGFARAYDHNFVIDAPPGQLRHAASLVSHTSGRSLSISTDRPCIHLYTGAGLDIPRGKQGASYGPFSGLALETQGFPDALNHRLFAAEVLRPGETFRSQTVFEFIQEPTT